MTCLGIVVGVICAQYVASSLFASAVWPILGIALFGFGLWRPMVLLIPTIIVSGILIGLWRGSITQAELTIYDRLIGATLAIEGTVTEDTELNDKDEVVMRLGQLVVDTHTLPGAMYTTSESKADIKRGDQVTVRGRLSQGFGTFPAAIYHAQIVKVQRPEPGDIARRVRDWFADAVRAAVPEPQASLGIGYLVGQRRGLPPELDEALRVAGLTHIVVASGYNLTILVRFARRRFEKVSKYLSALSSGSMIVGFMAVTGLSPSMSRAGLVAGLALLAWYYGRKFHPIILLLLAAAITLIINPSFGWNDLGWQLSFAAFAGVMIVAPLSQAYFFGDKKPGNIRQILGETVAAQLVTFPILVLAFGQFSNVAVLANLLVLPLVPLAMVLTFVAGVGSLLMPAFAPIVGAPASWLLNYMTIVAEQLAHLPWAQSELGINAWHVAGMYAVLVGVCIYIWRRTKFNLRNTSIIE